MGFFDDIGAGLSDWWGGITGKKTRDAKAKQDEVNRKTDELNAANLATRQENEAEKQRYGALAEKELGKTAEEQSAAAQKSAQEQAGIQATMASKEAAKRAAGAARASGLNRGQSALAAAKGTAGTYAGTFNPAMEAGQGRYLNAEEARIAGLTGQEGAAGGRAAQAASEQMQGQNLRTQQEMQGYQQAQAKEKQAGQILADVAGFGAKAAEDVATGGTAALIPSAKGGVFDEPTPLLVGEAGPEAVVPLNPDIETATRVGRQYDIQEILDTLRKVAEQNRREDITQAVEPKQPNMDEIPIKDISKPQPLSSSGDGTMKIILQMAARIKQLEEALGGAK